MDLELTLPRDRHHSCLWFGGYLRGSGKMREIKSYIWRESLLVKKRQPIWDSVKSTHWHLSNIRVILPARERRSCYWMFLLISGEKMRENKSGTEINTGTRFKKMDETDSLLVLFFRRCGRWFDLFRFFPWREIDPCTLRWGSSPNQQRRGPTLP